MDSRLHVSPNAESVQTSFTWIIEILSSLTVDMNPIPIWHFIYQKERKNPRLGLKNIKNVKPDTGQNLPRIHLNIVELFLV